MPPRGPNSDRRRRWGLLTAAGTDGGGPPSTKANNGRGINSGRNPGKKFSTNPGEGQPATITWIGTGNRSQSTTNGATVTPANPDGYSVVNNDLAIVLLGGRPAGSSEQPATPSGWAQHSTIFYELGANDMRLSLYYAWASGGTIPSPGFVVPATWSSAGTTAGLFACLAIYRNVNLATPFDITAVTSTSAAAGEHNPTDATSISNGAMHLSVVALADANSSWTLKPGATDSFTTRFYPAVGTIHATSAGSDLTWGHADRLYQGSAGPTWYRTSGGTAALCSIATALKPALL